MNVLIIRAKLTRTAHANSCFTRIHPSLSRDSKRQTKEQTQKSSLFWSSCHPDQSVRITLLQYGYIGFWLAYERSAFHWKLRSWKTPTLFSSLHLTDSLHFGALWETLFTCLTDESRSFPKDWFRSAFIRKHEWTWKYFVSQSAPYCRCIKLKVYEPFCFTLYTEAFMVFLFVLEQIHVVSRFIEFLSIYILHAIYSGIT